MERNLKLVNFNEQYWEFVRRIRFDPKNLNGFIKQKSVNKNQQKKYMSKNKNNYRICLLDNIPVGFVGSINGDIRICVDHKYKNKGIATFMILKSIEIWPKSFAKIKINNIESKKLFESCGFKLKYLIYEL